MCFIFSHSFPPTSEKASAYMMISNSTLIPSCALVQSLTQTLPKLRDILPYLLSLYGWGDFPGQSLALCYFLIYTTVIAAFWWLPPEERIGKFIKDHSRKQRKFTGTKPACAKISRKPSIHQSLAFWPRTFAVVIWNCCNIAGGSTHYWATSCIFCNFIYNKENT